MKKYNIALIPAHDSEKFIRYADQLSKNIGVDSYHIKPGTSFPHISLCHFLAQEQQIAAIWQQVQDLALLSLHISFSHHYCKIFPGHPKYAGVYWVSLYPNHREELKRYHLAIANIIKTPLNASFDRYDPHLTLFNTLSQSADTLFNHNNYSHPPLTEEFVLALGTTDGVGQITHILYSA